MAPSTLHDSILRPPILHILRAAGFHATRSAALDTLVDIASRYLILLASTTSSYTLLTNNYSIPTVTDLRMALQDVGALGPQIGNMEEQCRSEEDMRGVEVFVAWLGGDTNKEIRRIAGLDNVGGEVVEVENVVEREDYLTGMPSSSVHFYYECISNCLLQL